MHTSTVTVAVLDEAASALVHVDPGELREKFVVGSGKGGQHRNKTATAVQLLHLPTGIRVNVDGGRSQKVNRQTALRLLKAKLLQRQEHEANAQRNQSRKQQVGSGMRGDKIRTVRVRHDSVVDHRSGNKTTLSRYRRGYLEDLK